MSFSDFARALPPIKTRYGRYGMAQGFAFPFFFLFFFFFFFICFSSFYLGSYPRAISFGASWAASNKHAITLLFILIGGKRDECWRESTRHMLLAMISDLVISFRRVLVSTVHVEGGG
jgi:hypothetical protein